MSHSPLSKYNIRSSGEEVGRQPHNPVLSGLLTPQYHHSTTETVTTVPCRTQEVAEGLLGVKEH